MLHHSFLCPRSKVSIFIIGFLSHTPLIISIFRFYKIGWDGIFDGNNLVKNNWFDDQAICPYWRGASSGHRNTVTTRCALHLNNTFRISLILIFWFYAVAHVVDILMMARWFLPPLICFERR